MFKFGHVKPIWHETNFALQINIPIVNNMYTFYSHKQMEQMVFISGLPRQKLILTFLRKKEINEIRFF